MRQKRFVDRSRLVEQMTAFGVDVLVATSPENIFYATGYMPFQGVWNRFPKAVLAFRNGAIVLLLPMNEIGFVKDALDDSDIDLNFFGRTNFAPPAAEINDVEQWMNDHATGGAASIVDALAKAISITIDGRAPTVAVDQGGAAELRDLIASRLPGATVEGRGEDLWRKIRMIKTSDEIRQLRRAIAVNESGISAVEANAAAASEAELARIFHAAVGAAGGSVQHWIGSFDRKAGAYRKPGLEVGAWGSRFRYDCGISFEGYCSDLGGTWQIGDSPSTKERDIYKALTSGIEAAMEIATVGATTSKIYESVLDVIRRAGLPNYHHTLVGHGIGLEPRDYPVIGAPMKSTSRFLGEVFDPVLEAGMVLNIECPIIGLADGGFQHEVTLVVEDGGNRLLSQLRDYRTV